MTILRILLVTIATITVSPIASPAQIFPVDTLRIVGLRPDMSIDDVANAATAKVDTLVWGLGSSILQFRATFLGWDGQIKVEIENDRLLRITYILTGLDSLKTFQRYDEMEEKLTGVLGKPTDYYNNVYHLLTWRGAIQDLVLSTMDGKHYISVALRKHEGPPPPMPAPALKTKHKHRGKGWSKRQ